MNFCIAPILIYSAYWITYSVLENPIDTLLPAMEDAMDGLPQNSGQTAGSYTCS